MKKCSCVQSYTAGGSILCDPSKRSLLELFGLKKSDSFARGGKGQSGYVGYGVAD